MSWQLSSIRRRDRRTFVQTQQEAASPPNKKLSTTEEDLPTTLLSLLVGWMSLTVLRQMTVHSKRRMSLYRVSVRNAV